MTEARNDKLILTAIVTLLIVMAASKRVYGPVIRYNREMKQKTQEITQQIKEAMTYTANMKMYRDEEKKLQTHLEKLNTEVFQGNQLELVKKVWTVSEKENIRILELQPEKEQDSEFVRESSYNMQFESDFASLVSFIRICNDELPLNLQISDIRLESKGKYLSGNMKLKIKTVKE